MPSPSRPKLITTSTCLQVNDLKRRLRAQAVQAEREAARARQQQQRGDEDSRVRGTGERAGDLTWSFESVCTIDAIKRLYVSTLCYRLLQRPSHAPALATQPDWDQQARASS